MVKTIEVSDSNLGLDILPLRDESLVLSIRS